MNGGEIIIGVGIGAALIASGVWFFRESRSARGSRLIDEFWNIYGDVPTLPAEAKRAGEKGPGGGGSKAHRLVTHESSLNQSGRRGGV